MNEVPYHLRDGDELSTGVQLAVLPYRASAPYTKNEPLQMPRAYRGEEEK
ncbi:hypothetical protein [Coleofasciculus sp. H7-2]